jgi:hypothetical protein
MASDVGHDLPDPGGQQLPLSKEVGHRRRSWCLQYLPACVTIIALIGVGMLLVTRHNDPRDPIVEVGGGALEATFCFGAAPAVTSGAESLNNRSSHPVMVTSASPLSTTNAQLMDTAVVALTGRGFVGRGVGLPTSDTRAAAGLTPKDWATRQFVPTAVIPPRSRDRNVHGWQLVFGMRVLQPGVPATLKQVRVTFRQGHHTYHLTSRIHVVISGTATPPTHC